MKSFKFAFPLVTIILTIWLVMGPPARVGFAPMQPFQYNHQIHAGTYNIDCRYCHTGVEVSKKAGVPSLNICMNCHASLGFQFKNVLKLQKMYREKKSPQWVRVHNLPDHAKFSHAPHIKALSKPDGKIQVVCAECHGNVAQMKVVTQVKDHNMGWCVSCHRSNADLGAKINCSTCHY